MSAFNRLPRRTKVVISAILVLLFGTVVYLTVVRAHASVVVVESRDQATIDAARVVLDRSDVSFATSRREDTVMLTVPKQQATLARQALANSAVAGRLDKDIEVECPEVPGFTTTPAPDSADCEAARAVQELLVSGGVVAANVQVRTVQNHQLLGPDRSQFVEAQVFLPTGERDAWDAEQAALDISRSVGTYRGAVTITDDRMQPLFDGSSASARHAADADETE
jgi:hypothetical protein